MLTNSVILGLFIFARARLAKRMCGRHVCIAMRLNEQLEGRTQLCQIPRMRERSEMIRVLLESDATASPIGYILRTYSPLAVTLWNRERSSRFQCGGSRLSDLIRLRERNRSFHADYLWVLENFRGQGPHSDHSSMECKLKTVHHILASCRDK